MGVGKGIISVILAKIPTGKGYDYELRSVQQQIFETCTVNFQE